MSNTSVSLDGLSISDLNALQTRIDEQIKAKHEEAKQVVKNRVLVMLADSGFSFSEIFPSSKTQKISVSDIKPKVRVKYSDGQNNWTGRGRMPLWVKTFIQSGGELASLNVLK